jgi:hypothetical protein
MDTGTIASAPNYRSRWYRGGYTSFYCKPGTVKEWRCRICNAICTVERNRLCAGSFTEHMAGHKSLHDHFFCPHVGEGWHDYIDDLIGEAIDAQTDKFNAREKREYLLGERLKPWPIRRYFHVLKNALLGRYDELEPKK